MRKNSPFVVIAVCLIWGAFAAAAVYFNSNGSMPADGRWKFEIDPVGRIKPIDLFFEENPVRGTLKIALRPTAWLMDQKASGYRPHIFKTEAYILPPGIMDIVLETNPDQEKIALRISLTESLPSAVLYYQGSRVVKRIPLDLTKAKITPMPAGEKSLKTANTLRTLSQWEPRIGQKISAAISLGEQGMQIQINGTQVASAPYNHPPFRVGISALGVDFPVFVEQIDAEFFLPEDPSSKTDYVADFGGQRIRWGALTLWIVFAGMFFAFSKGLGKLLSLGNSVRGKIEKERAHTAFWPVIFAPIFLWPGTIVPIGLCLFVIFRRLKKSFSGTITKPASLSLPSVITLAFLAFAVTFRQGSALYEVSSGLLPALGNLLVIWLFWAVPFVVLIALARYKPLELVKPMIPILAGTFVVQLAYLQGVPDGAIRVAVLVFGCFVLGAGFSVFIRQNAQRPNITLFVLALLLWPAAEAAYRTGLIVDVPGERLPKEYKADKSLFWTLKERPVPFSHEKPAGEMRVISLGGSVTWGAGVLQKERTYPLVMQKELNRLDPERSWVVMNAGVPGYCSVQGLLSLQSHIDTKPDIVTVCFGVNEYNRSGFHSTLAQYKERMQDGQSKVTNIQNIMQRSFLYRLLRSIFTRRNSQTFDNELAAPNTRPDEFAKILEQIDDYCRKNGARAVFLSEAHILQLLGPHEVDPYSHQMKRISESRAIPLVDIQDILRKHKEDDLLLDTIHPTPHFHKLIGQKTAGKILEMTGSGN